ncbi:hypothetical protein PMAL9190_00531 [Photobacterium malacitanum]|uniref:Uncharacterized protein n=1 Tax=Photobacterium malacitanum TaxID=2204294 RepID=A0A1Y6M932_9GAMM|nr:hypothetical protein PMAL9190_00531 [Photobacterium malacitanum]
MKSNKDKSLWLIPAGVSLLIALLGVLILTPMM